MDFNKVKSLFNNYNYYICSVNTKNSVIMSNNIVTCKEFKDFQDLVKYSDDGNNLHKVGINPVILRVCKYNSNKYSTLQKKLGEKYIKIDKVI